MSSDVSFWVLTCEIIKETIQVTGLIIVKHRQNTEKYNSDRYTLMPFSKSILHSKARISRRVANDQDLFQMLFWILVHQSWWQFGTSRYKLFFVASSLVIDRALHYETDNCSPWRSHLTVEVWRPTRQTTQKELDSPRLTNSMQAPAEVPRELVLEGEGTGYRTGRLDPNPWSSTQTSLWFTCHELFWLNYCDHWWPKRKYMGCSISIPHYLLFIYRSEVELTMGKHQGNEWTGKKREEGIKQLIYHLALSNEESSPCIHYLIFLPSSFFSSSSFYFTSLMVTNIPMLLWGWLGKSWSRSFMNRSARPDVSLRLGQGFIICWGCRRSRSYSSQRTPWDL